MEGKLMSAPYLTGPSYYFTDLETNVLQVAIDHMVEHLEDLLSDSDWKTEEELSQLKLEHQERLEAAKRLKERFV